MRSLFLYNSILFLGLPFCDQKGKPWMRSRYKRPCRKVGGAGGARPKTTKNRNKILHFPPIPCMIVYGIIIEECAPV